MNLNLRILAVALASASAGCSLVVDPEKSDPLQTAEGFCNSIQDAANSRACDVFNSGAAMPVQVLARAASDQWFEAYRGRCDALQGEVDGGRFTYDSGAAEGCIAALEQRGCRGMDGDYFEWPSACARVVQGNVAPGGACLRDQSNYATVQGATSFRLNECAQGASCFNPVATCGSGKCLLPASIGQQCQTAATPQGCAEGLYCGANVCQPVDADPVSCLADPRICDPRSTACDSSLGICQPLPLEGQACASSQCAPGLICDYLLNTCMKKPAAPIGEGGYCGSIGTSWCADGLYCDSGLTKTCVRQRTSGACMYFEECAPGHGCVYGAVSSSCTPLTGLGGTCSTSGTTMGVYCQSGLVCSAVYPATVGTCILPPGLGQPCLGAAAVPTGTCAPGLRPYMPPAPGVCTCQEFLGEGALCAMSDECGIYAGTGRECVWDSAMGQSTCRTSACLVPAGWFAKGPMY